MDFLTQGNLDWSPMDAHYDRFFIGGRVYDAVYPTPDPASLPRHNNTQEPSQLDAIVAFLAHRIAKLVLRSWRVTFPWRGADQTMLIAEIAGSDPHAAPVLLTDDVDTGFADDVYHRTGERVSVPGADDDV